MSDFVRNRVACGAEDPDLLCVEVSALGAAPPTAVPHVGCDKAWPRELPLPDACGMSVADQTREDFLRSLLLKTDAYRPRQSSLPLMEDSEAFLDMRTAVVHWFANVAVSYEFSDETVVAALSNFDRYISITLEPIENHLLLQLAAYVALLVASKMSEISPLRMKSLANLTGRMFTPLQVQKCEMDMISKLQFRLAPPSADETLHCLSTLIHSSWSSSVPASDVLASGASYLKKARARTCWFRHSPYTLAVAALTASYNSLGLGQLKRRLLRECDGRARAVTGRGLDIVGVAACVEAMSVDERAVATAAAARAARRGSNESPVCSNEAPAKEGWGSPTGVAQGAAELLRQAAFSAVGGVPLVEDFSPAPSPKAFTPCAELTTAGLGVDAGCTGSSASVRMRANAPRPRAPSPTPIALRQQQRVGIKRPFHQTFGSCFVPCAARSRVEGLIRVHDRSAIRVGHGGVEDRGSGRPCDESNCSRQA